VAFAAGAVTPDESATINADHMTAPRIVSSPNLAVAASKRWAEVAGRGFAARAGVRVPVPANLASDAQQAASDSRAADVLRALAAA